MDLLVTLQRWINTAIAAGLSAFATTRNWTALIGVLPLGIVFGAVHALTPGHGKTVLATYLAGSRLAVLRGVAVAGVFSLTHIGSAVLLAVAAAPIVSRTFGSAGRAPILEDVSRGLLALIGLWLVVRAVRQRPLHTHQGRPGEGMIVGVIAGLMPCPLTLFTMFFALSRSVPEAGLMFAFAMMIGVGLTLALVGLATVLARDAITSALSQHGASIDLIGRSLDGLAGVVLVVIGFRELLR